MHKHGLDGTGDWGVFSNDRLLQHWERTDGREAVQRAMRVKDYSATVEVIYVCDCGHHESWVRKFGRLIKES